MPSLHTVNRRRRRQSAPQPMTPPATAGDSERVGFKPKAQPGTPEYKRKVAEPTMETIDALPKPWRDLVAEYDYIPVFLAGAHGAGHLRWCARKPKRTAEYLRFDRHPTVFLKQPCGPAAIVT